MKTLVLGNQTKDIIRTKDGLKSQTGGPNFFIKAALEKLGVEVKQIIPNTNIVITIDEVDTTNAPRVFVTSKTLKNIIARTLEYPDSFDNVIISTVFDEISYDDIHKLKQKFQCPIYIDIQGYQRKLNSVGIVSRKKSDERFLETADVIKMNEAEFEIQFASNLKTLQKLSATHDKLYLITYAGKKIEVIQNGKVFRFDIEDNHTFSNTVGAGDTFFAAFIHYLQTNSPKESMQFAHEFTFKFLLAKNHPPASRQLEVSDIFLKIVVIPSPSGDESRLKGYVKEFCKIRNISLMEDKFGNLFFANRNSKLLLTAHLDTVQKDTVVKPIIKDDVIYSSGDSILGADDKANLAAILKIVDDYFQESKKIDFELLFTVEEELGMKGAKNFDFKKLYSKNALSFDKSNSKIGSIVTNAVYGESIEIEFLGIAAHPSTPANGVNALKLAAKCLARFPIGQVNKELTLNFGLIEGGSVGNMIPDYVKVKGDMRGFNNTQIRKLVKKLQKILEEEASKFNASFKLNNKSVVEGYKIDTKDKLYLRAKECITELGLETTNIKSFGGSDVNVIRQNGINGLLIASGSMNAHSNDEYIKIRDLEMIVQIIRNIIYK